jgi:hypothetical protein
MSPEVGVLDAGSAPAGLRLVHAGQDYFNHFNPSVQKAVIEFRTRI